MRRAIALLFFLSVLPGLAGCGTIYKAAVDQRDIGTFVDDGRIESSVRARFINDDAVKLRDLSVNSYLGTVYIVGEFESDAQKMRSKQLAMEVSGVRRVTIVPFPKRDDPTCGTTDDIALYAKIKASLVEDSNIWSTHVDVKTVQCNAVILGIVDSQREADTIFKHVRGTDGVRGVQNLMRISR